MNKKILFSPVGGTDPITNQYDGSLLHIVRHYQPDKIYLFLSKEISECEKKDHRYTCALQRLGEQQHREYEVCLFVREDLVEVQDYNTFYAIFHELLQEIAEKEDLDQKDLLYINVASGTPAMKSALEVLSVLSEHQLVPIQVTNPKRTINKNIIDYDMEKEWEEDKDNFEKTDNRCVEVKRTNLLLMLKRDMIRKHVLVYDYVAALQVAQTMKREASYTLINLLQLANARLLLDYAAVDRYQRSLPEHLQKLLVPFSGKGRDIFEYTLYLQIKLKKKEYADFVRAITPLVVDVFEEILKVKGNVRLEEYTVLNRNGVRKWNLRKLEKTEAGTVLKKHAGTFKEGPVYSQHLLWLIQDIIKESRIFDNAKKLRDAEEHIRNLAAHEIVSVTPEKIIKLTGMSPDRMMQLIKELVLGSGLSVTGRQWQSYDFMNEEILKYVAR